MFSHTVSLERRVRQAALPCVTALGLSLGLASCAVGPDFKSPEAPKTNGYTAETLKPETSAANIHGGEVQRFVTALDIPGQWWSLYHSDGLNALIAKAIANSPTLDAAKAALREAHENAAAARGAFFPTLTGSVSATRQKITGAEFGAPQAGTTIFSVGTGQLNVSYPLDVFGGIRRQVEAAEANEDFERYELAAAYITLTSNVVTAAVQEASLRAQITATQQIIDIETDELKVLRQQLSLGGVAGGAVLAQEATLAQARTSLPPLQKQLDQIRNQLAALAGQLPSEEIDTTFDLAQLTLPQELPLSLPSKLVEQRPDIRAADARLHQASAQIGVALANEFPQINITGSFGNVGSPAGSLLNPGVGIWSVGGSIAQTIFDGATLLHKERAAVAAFDQTAAQYKSTVIGAFQDVANAIRALQADADSLAAATAAEIAANKSLALSREQYQLGAIPYTALLTAEQLAQQAAVTRAQAQAARYADTAALFQALGGGWWNADAGVFETEKPADQAAKTPSE
jgi:NodT family efflux transporter outer membrane factor (OMF) lipoprotein